MCHFVRVPAGIGGRCRSQGASGLARISKFEKYVAPVNTPSATNSERGESAGTESVCAVGERAPD
jgi:hypothetical protein